jgi:hypothetical protein
VSFLPKPAKCWDYSTITPSLHCFLFFLISNSFLTPNTYTHIHANCMLTWEN